MRWALFVLGALLLAAGIALAIIYPRLMQSSPGPELARWQAYDGEAFRSERVRLSTANGDTVLTAEMLVEGPMRGGEWSEVLAVSVTDELESEVFRASIGFDASGTLQSPQTGVLRHTRTVPLLDETAGRFVITPDAGPHFPENALGVELVVRSATAPVEPLARPIGITLSVIGLISVLLGSRRRRENPNAQPRAHWGRR